MTAIAVIIGIDDYKVEPLTSARTDALAFRDALLELELVEAANAIVLTSPALSGTIEASRRGILAVLKELYDNGAALDRLYFFFAGHGLSAYTTASRSTHATMLIPREVEDLASDANLLINFDELRQRLEIAGPAEQFFFVDACRDLAFGNRPGDPPGLGWEASRQRRSGQSAQMVLYAVSVGGKAVGVPQGSGVMTSALIDALHAERIAIDYNEDDDEFVVTAESVSREVIRAIDERMTGHQYWTHQLMTPDFRVMGPPLAPLRVLDPAPHREFRLIFDPVAAAEWTSVRVKSGRDVLSTPCWPPLRSGQIVTTLYPRVYRLDVRVDRGEVEVQPPKIDLRMLDTATIRVREGGPPLVVISAVPEPGPGTAEITTSTIGDERAGVIAAAADEVAAVIEIDQLDPPYRHWSGTSDDEAWPSEMQRPPRLRAEVPPGNYAVRFRLGSEVYSHVELDITDGEIKRVEPSARESAVLPRLQVRGGPVLLSESIGPLRASTLLTALPIIAVSPFDETGYRFGAFRASLETPIEPIAMADFWNRPVRVVVAVDGFGWPMPASAVAAEIRCDLVDRGGAATRVLMRPLSDGQDGWARVAHGTTEAPPNGFTVRLRSPVLGEIEFPAAAVSGLITVVGLVVTPDGRLDATTHLLRPPTATDFSYSREIRDLVLGQRLYAARELTNRGPSALMDATMGLTVDPIFTCMAYYACADALAAGDPLPPRVSAEDLATAAQRLATDFAEIPDARLIADLAGVGHGQQLWPGEVPILARSVREAAATLTEAHRWASLLAPDQTWTVLWRADRAAAGLAALEPVHA